MKIINIDKNYSWLQWPVSTKHGGGIKNLHLTVKFFGDAKINPDYVKASVMGGHYLPRDKFAWKPVMFADLIYVLEFVKFPPAVKSLHDHFGLLKDEFEPYRPHITVDKKYWEMVRDINLSPIDEELRFGELELYLGKCNGERE